MTVQYSIPEILDLLVGEVKPTGGSRDTLTHIPNLPKFAEVCRWVESVVDAANAHLGAPEGPETQVARYIRNEAAKITDTYNRR